MIASPIFTFVVDFAPAGKPPPPAWIKKQMTSPVTKIFIRDLAGTRQCFCPSTARTMRPRYMYVHAAKKIGAKVSEVIEWRKVMSMWYYNEPRPGQRIQQLRLTVPWYRVRKIYEGSTKVLAYIFHQRLMECRTFCFFSR